MAGLYDLLAEGRVKREEDTDGVGFLISDKSLFSEKGMVMLSREHHSGFIKCSRTNQGNAVFLKYNAATPERRTLQSMLVQMTADDFVRCMVNLKSIFDIINFDVNNGFFNRNNVAISFNDVFIDVDSFRAYIMYLPLNSEDNSDSCEYLLGREILTAVSQYVNLCNYMSKELCEAIQRNTPVFQAIAEISGKYRIKSDNYDILCSISSVSAQPDRNNYISYGDNTNRRVERKKNENYTVIDREPDKHSTDGNAYALMMNSQLTSTDEFHGSMDMYSSSQIYSPESDSIEQFDDSATQVIGNSGLYLISKKRNIEFPLNYGANTVGRSQTVDINLDPFGNKTISHVHATVYVDADRKITVVDNSSKNGTSIVVKGLFKKSRVLRLLPKRTYPVYEGNLLVFANEEFVIVRKK